MRTPLLSFLSDFEDALQADDPSPDGGTWVTQRSVNYQRGLARIDLSVRTESGALVERGAMLLQGYQLADGTPCLKAQLNWKDSNAPRICSFFHQPELNWRSEARKAAAEWMAGPATLAEPVQSETEGAAAVFSAPALAVG